jgi:hypothetical protein
MPTPSLPPVPGVSARTAEVLQLQCAPEIVQVMHVEWRVLRGELDVVVIAGVPDQLNQRRPARQEVCADGRLTGGEQRAKPIVTHDLPYPLIVTGVRSAQ